MARVCDDKSIDLIASGYNREVLPYAWLALISGLAGIEYRLEEPEPIPPGLGTANSFAETEKALEEVRSHLKDYWTCLR